MTDFPIIDIQHFVDEKSVSKNGFLFSDLYGAHRIDKPHQHFFFLLVLFEKGSGEHTIDFKTYPISDNQIHVLFPNQVHTWNIEIPSKAYQLMIDKVFFEKLSLHFRHSFAYYQQHPVISLSPKVLRKLRYEFKAIQEELNDSNGLADLIHSRVSVIASILSKEVEINMLNEDNNPYSLRLIQLQELLEIYFREEKKVEFYADELHISASQLSKICRKYLSASPAQLIHQRLVLEAKRLLKSTDQSIKEIAFQLGFADAPYFTNFFKKNTGMNPSDFRS
ncbi:helix-turn-helix transcriptional regulator [Sphingobacterium cellulitidis]|uniref:helix-turn-helix transcriptional regulator n=1 Tax=Sphingobacterium cellulitidis TaxID=1768011 RepID=UPI000B93BC18|nr:hypothetical protein CHT99_16910 [Sphingobacterium cellulitidis]